MPFAGERPTSGVCFQLCGLRSRDSCSVVTAKYKADAESAVGTREKGGFKVPCQLEFRTQSFPRTGCVHGCIMGAILVFHTGQIKASLVHKVLGVFFHL